MTTTPCVSPSTGALSPDMRINYAYGMVLGVDDFVQEQLHRLSHGWLHHRALHGFGTVSGLAVASTAAAGASDFTVSVSTGIAVDQRGREIVIRCDQCARIGAWLAAQEQADAGIISRHLGPSGELTVYVVVSYAECVDALVPIPGQPCSSSEQSSVPSRIRDAWDVDFRWDPPEMARWDSDRRLARLLASVDIVAGLDPSLSDETAIRAAVADLINRAADGPDDLEPESNPSTPVWRLPAEEAAAALDRILTEWVTRVRPHLTPGLADVPSDPATADPAVLLAALTLVPANPFDPSAPSIVACSQPDEEGRPYLLHTQLIQELHRLGGAIVAPVTAAVTTAASVAVTVVDQTTVIDVWFHLDEPVQLPATVTVTDEDGGNRAFSTAAIAPVGGFAQRWTLTSPEPGAGTNDGLQLAMHLPLTTVLVGDTTTTLAEVASQLALLDCDDTEVTVYGQVHNVPEAPPPPPPANPTPSSEFVTMVTEYADGPLNAEMWFHPQPRDKFGDEVVAEKPALRVFDDTTGNDLPITLSGPSPWTGNVWRVRIDNPYEDRRRPVYVRVIFLAEEFILRSQDGNTFPLSEWIDKIDANFIGWDPSARQIVAFLRNPGAVGDGTTLGPFQ